MGVSWMQQLSSPRPGKEGRENISGRWRVNIFFFLLVSVHSLVLPWLPVILQTSGHTSSGIGVVMACVVVASLFSVKSCMVFVTATRSGAVRRFTLFLLLISSLTMYVIAIVILPRELSFKECSPLISEVGGQTLAPTSTLTSSYATSELLLQNISTSPIGTGNTPAFSSMTSGPEFSKESAKGTSASPHTSTSASIQTVELLTKKTTMTTTATLTMNSVSISPTPTTFFEQLISSSNRKTSNGLNQITKESSGEIIVIPDSSSLAAASYFGGESTTLGTDLIRQQESSITLESSSDSIISDHLNRKLHKYEIPETSQHLRNHGQWLGLHGIEGKEEALSPHNDYPLRNPFQKTPVDDFRPNDHHTIIPLEDFSRNSIKLFDADQETIGAGDLSENNVMPEPRSRITVHDNYNQLLDSDHFSTNSKHRNLLNPSIRSSVDGMKHDGGTSRNQRIKRSIKFRNDMNDGKHRFYLNDEVISAPKASLLNDNISYDKEEVGITKGPVQASLGYTWLWVSILVVSASLLGSGIETSVTRLWHCYSHGYHLFHDRSRLDGGGDDLLQRILTDTFELSASGEHYGWSRVLAGGVVVAAGLLLALGCQVGLSPGWSLAGQAGLFTVGSVFTVAALLIVLPVPYGSIKPPKMSRPLSLYLDDEVLWEGLRRIACPAAAAIHGAFCALPALYGVLILDEFSQQTPYGPALVVLSVACMLLGEGATTCCRRRLSTILDSPGLVGLSLGSLAVQLLLTYALGQGGALWFVAATWLSVGASQALIVISMRQNALMLATIKDQEREAWVSWCSGRVGAAMGAVLWPLVSSGRWGEGNLHRLLVPVASATAVLAVAVTVVAVLTRSRRAARRRVYHTLDLNACDADDEEQGDEEEDWLVRGARKEGLEL